MLSVDKVALNGSAGFNGRLGFLEVAGSAGLTTSKPDADSPALAVQLNDLKGVKVGESATDTSAMLIAELLAKPLSYIDVATNLQVNGDVTLNADAIVGSAGGELQVRMAPRRRTPRLRLPGRLRHPRRLRRLRDADRHRIVDGGDRRGRRARQADRGERHDQRDGPHHQARPRRCHPHPRPAAGLPDHGGAEQLDADLHPHRPRGLRPGTAPLAAGDYQVVGNTLSHLVEILTTVAGFADALQQAFDAAQLGDDVEIWGVKPSDVAAQARKLKLLVDEMRGVAAAVVVITCTPPAGTELRGLPVGSGSDHVPRRERQHGGVERAMARSLTPTPAPAPGCDDAGTTVGTDAGATQALTVPDSVDQNTTASSPWAPSGAARRRVDRRAGGAPRLACRRRHRVR